MLLKGYKKEVYLSGNSACKWYINIKCDEVRSLRDSLPTQKEPVKWLDLPQADAVRSATEAKSIIEIKDLNPFVHKKIEFVVTVTIKKIDGSWWYIACDRCRRTARPYGKAYRCGGEDCPAIVPASPRFKLGLIAGDDTADTRFVLFGRMAQRIIGKSVNNIVGNCSHALLLLQSPSASQAISAVPLLTMSPSASEGMSVGQQSITATPLGFNSPPVTPMKGKTIDQECSSKTPIGIPVGSEDEDDDNVTLATLKCPSPATKHSTSKAPRKRARSSPESATVKKIFKDDDEEKGEKCPEKNE